jgi:hypothetical protein
MARAKAVKRASTTFRSTHPRIPASKKPVQVKPLFVFIAVKLGTFSEIVSFLWLKGISRLE